ncbi:MAG: hypothetical protein M3Z36_01285, partial [Acidobacteriota bacterium]|nr:hypothetical protein [Acidobacteriota bacterium]
MNLEIREPESFPRVVRQKNQEDEREVEKIAVDILQDERESTLAAIGFARLADGAGGRIGPERFVICAALVVTGE